MEILPNLSYPVGEYRVFRIVPSDPESMTFLSQLHVRALEFCEKYQSDTDPVWLAQLLYNVLRNQPHLVYVIVAVDKFNEIAAHAIVFVDSYGALGAVAMWLQTEKNGDLGLEDWSAINDLALRLVKEWMVSLKIKTALSYALTPALARLDQRAGFRTYRTITRMDLD
jgi:hypothetical protein